MVGLALVAAVVPVAAVARGAGSKTVVLEDVAFSPRSLSVSRDTKVTFAFRDVGTTHNVTSTARPARTATSARFTPA